MPRKLLWAAFAVALVVAGAAATATAQKLGLRTRPAAAMSVRPWLGVNLAQGKYGVKIDAVYPGAPAELAGIESGDEIFSIDGQRLRTYQELQKLVGQRRQVGDEIDIKLLRDGRVVRLAAVLGRFPDDAEPYLLRVERPAIDFSLPALYGDRRGELASYRGDAVLLAFVSRDCAQCPVVLEALSRQAQRFGDQGLAVLAITDRPSAAALRRDGQPAPSFQLLYDAGGQVSRLWLGRQVKPPVLFVLDRDGVVRWAGRDLEGMETSVQAALRERNGVPIESSR